MLKRYRPCCERIPRDDINNIKHQGPAERKGELRRTIISWHLHPCEASEIFRKRFSNSRLHSKGSTEWKDFQELSWQGISKSSWRSGRVRGKECCPSTPDLKAVRLYVKQNLARCIKKLKETLYPGTVELTPTLEKYTGDTRSETAYMGCTSTICCSCQQIEIKSFFSH